jgi:hypothetical protein
MGPEDDGTGVDWAWAAANDAKRENANLAERITRLEQRVDAMSLAVLKLIRVTDNSAQAERT